MNKKLTWSLVLVVVVIVAIFVFARKPSTQGTIKIGGAFSLTGIAASWGEAEQNGTIFAVEEANRNGGINGARIELIVEDTASDGPKTVSAVSKLININSVKAILGASWLDSIGGGAVPLSDQYDKVMITASAAITAIQVPTAHKNIFSTWYRSDQEAEKLADYLVTVLHKKNVVVIAQNDTYWNDFFERFANKAKNLSANVNDVKFNGGEEDFRTLLIKIKSQRPDALVFGANEDKELLPLLKQRKELIPQISLFTTEFILDYIAKPEYGRLLAGTTYINPKGNGNSDFAVKYKERFHADPVFSASNAYDAAVMLITALRSGATETASIRNYLLRNQFDTVTFGKTNFDEIGGITGGSFEFKAIQ